MDRAKTLIKKYYEEEGFIDSEIRSFNDFVDKKLQKIIDQNKEVEPTIIPHNVEDFKIRFDKIWVTQPEITEADGSTRPIYPTEARLRKISYAAPVHLEVSAHINGVQRETFTTQIGTLPIMLKSKYCHLSKLKKDELIARGEDPTDPGGYFIINGTEKVLIAVEDLAPNTMLVEKNKLGTSLFTGRLFSEGGAYKIPHVFEKMKDGIYYLSFTRVKKVPVIVLMKALGLVKDEEIMRHISKDKHFDSVIVNLFEYVDIKTQEDALDFLAKKTGITQAREQRIERMTEILDKYLLPHVGMEEDSRDIKSKNLAKLLKKFAMACNGDIPLDDKDHYSNKRLKMSGDLLSDLFAVNFKVLINDMLYNFQRIVKRGKFPSLKVLIREKLLTQRIYSSMATGSWSGGRKGISQRIQRLNFNETMSHLQRIVSPLSASQENFAARELHPTHWGRICAMESPEGTNIGLRKNMALLAKVSADSAEEDIVKSLKTLGVKVE